ncbi:Ubiquitin-like domain superfamily [Sesbania bispinosa]|nr:Ubiquitin-like domain superfamily [Sesbania bispinosa]
MSSGVTNNEEDKKPTDQGAHINLKVKGQDGNEVFFRIKRSTQLKKLMNAYCDRQSVDFNSIAFLFDGRRLRAEQTPDELEMEDGDEIDAMLHQTGELSSCVVLYPRGGGGGYEVLGSLQLPGGGIVPSLFGILLNLNGDGSDGRLGGDNDGVAEVDIRTSWSFLTMETRLMGL